KLHEHIKISANDKKYKQYNNLDCGFITTVGQLNFFRWAIENGIIKYALDNLEELEESMLQSMKNKKCKGTYGNKRKQLSPNLTKSMTIHKTKILVKFD
ncbi:uncharacterized protein METZ01_LOCUS446365, partial [marine metagenome]